MSDQDDWLRRKARERSQEVDESARLAELERESELQRKRILAGQLGSLWAALGNELRRQSQIYNDAAKRPDAMYLEVHADMISIRLLDGGAYSLQIDRETGGMRQTVRSAGGGTNVGSPQFRITYNMGEQKLTFSSGSPSDVASQIMRELLEF